MANDSYKMPPVEIGEVILWYPDGKKEDTPAPAIVTHIGDRTLAIAIIAKDAYSLTPEDGVRHMSDPGLETQENRSRGAWEYGPTRKQLEALKVLMGFNKTKEKT